MSARALLVACVVLLAAAPGASAALRAGGTGMRAIATGGFGDRANGYAWSMAWFQGRLYVGTARSPLCVERATMDFYFPREGFYVPRPARDIACPASIDRADLRAEIWRFTPSTRRWERVLRSPTVPNPEARGRRIARDIGFRGMAVLREPGRPPALYVGAVTANEFRPGLRRRRGHGPVLLRTTDGRRFRRVRASVPVLHGRAGAQRAIGFRSLTVAGGRLFVTASAGLTGDGVVLRVDRPSGRRARMTQVSPPQHAVFELEPFAGALYAGTGDPQHGYGVWRAEDDGTRWRPVVTGGAGRGPAVTSVVSMARYRGRLYVGASGWGTPSLAVSELVSVTPAGRWDVVAGAARTTADGVTHAPLSGLGDGFGNAYNIHFWRMEAFGGALVLGTNDWSWWLRDLPGAGDALRAQFGFDLYVTCDGRRWSAATVDGFGRATDFGVRTMASTPAGLFVGTTDLVRGASVLRTRRSPCAGRTRTWPARAAATRDDGRWRRQG